MADTARDAMNAALDKLNQAEINFMDLLCSGDTYEEAQLVREILDGLHEAKKQVRLCEYRGRRSKEES